MLIERSDGKGYINKDRISQFLRDHSEKDLFAAIDAATGRTIAYVDRFEIARLEGTIVSANPGIYTVVFERDENGKWSYDGWKAPVVAWRILYGRAYEAVSTIEESDIDTRDGRKAFVLMPEGGFYDDEACFADEQSVLDWLHECFPLKKDPAGDQP